MREQEVRDLYEAYMQVHQPQEEVEQLDENIQGAVKGALDKGAKFMKNNPVGKAVSKVIAPVGSGRGTPTATSGGYRPEEVETDLFDTILEYLVVEGYADTNEAALVIMANMSEEWRQDIMEISQKTATKAYAASKTGEFEGADSDRDIKRSDNLRRHIKRKFGAGAAKHADSAADSMTFGRKDASGKSKGLPKSRIEKSDYRTTKDGKMHKQDQRELKTDLRIKRDRRLRAAEDN